MVCPGGELAFVTRMAEESSRLRGRVHWYTTMVGKKATLKELRRRLHALGVSALRTTELAQGSTSRWAAAWSFAADPNTANVPLRSRVGFDAPAAADGGGGGGDEGGAGAAAAAAAAASGLPPPRRAVRSTSFALAAAPAEGRRILSAAAALLGRAGAADCRVDAGAWTVRAELPLQPPVAAPAPVPGEPPAKKRVRIDDGSGNGGNGGGSGGTVGVRLLVSQQHRGVFTVAASIANDSSELAARAFTDAVHSLREDLELMWPAAKQ